MRSTPDSHVEHKFSRYVSGIFSHLKLSLRLDEIKTISEIVHGDDKLFHPGSIVTEQVKVIAFVSYLTS